MDIGRYVLCNIVLLLGIISCACSIVGLFYLDNVQVNGICCGISFIILNNDFKSPNPQKLFQFCYGKSMDLSKSAGFRALTKKDFLNFIEKYHIARSIIKRYLCTLLLLGRRYMKEM